MFEVSKRSLGRAGMCWSQPLAQKVEDRKKKNLKKNWYNPTG
jgi:hypothetical protein